MNLKFLYKKELIKLKLKKIMLKYVSKLLRKEKKILRKILVTPYKSYNYYTLNLHLHILNLNIKFIEKIFNI